MLILKLHDIDVVHFLFFFFPEFNTAKCNENNVLHSQFHFDKLTANAFFFFFNDSQGHKIAMGLQAKSSCSKAGVGNLQPAGQYYAASRMSSEPPHWRTSHGLKWG